jgi:predicted amidohydrolase
MTHLLVGLTQWRITRDQEANLDIACRLIERSAARGARLVLLPENALTLGSNAWMRAAAVDLDGPELALIGAAAKAAGTTVVLGGVKRRVPGETAVRNTAVVLGADGSVVGGYDKIHLFDATVGGRDFRASEVETPGARPVLIDLDGVLAGVTICYDVRFPELYRRLAQAGAQLLLVPAAFTRTTGQAHWHTLLRARAIENAAYVLASATISDDSDGFPTYGHALAVSPWGEVLADLGEADCACQVLDLDLDQVGVIREAMPVLAGSRSEICARDPDVIRIPPAEPTQEI